SSTSSGSSSNRRSTSRSKSNSKRTSPKTARERQQQKEKGSQNLETLLLSTHTMLALISKTPELQLTKDESTKLAEAINEVNALYDFSVLPPEVMAWINLLIVAGGIYVPRFIAVKVKKGTKKGQVITGTPVKVQPISFGIPD